MAPKKIIINIWFLIVLKISFTVKVSDTAKIKPCNTIMIADLPMIELKSNGSLSRK